MHRWVWVTTLERGNQYEVLARKSTIHAILGWATTEGCPWSLNTML